MDYYVDTHFHLDLWKEPHNLVKELDLKQIYTIAVTNTPSIFYHTRELTYGKKYVKPALGFHPELVAQRSHEINQFIEQIAYTRFIGEVGLDYSTTDKKAIQIQQKIFTQIIKICSESTGKVLTVHSRKAERDVIDIIGENFPGKVILHWYSGPLKELEKAITYGFYFSVNHAMVNSKNGQKIISKIPINQLLTESDGPFIKYNNEKCSPYHISLVIKKLAAILNINEELIKHHVYQNFKRLLILSPEL